MSEFVMVKRELLERLLSSIDAHCYGFDGDEELRAVLAQEAGPAVERQEPFAYSFRFAGCVTASGPEAWRNELDREKPAQFLFDDGRVKDFLPLYTSPPAPAAVDERAEFDAWTVRKGRVAGYLGWRDDFAIWQARACLDKVKELNR